MEHPLIGITSCVDRGQKLRPGRDYAYLAQAYVDAVASVGGLPLMIGAPADVGELAERLDGLVISGGDDLPTSFEEEASQAPAQDLAEDAERTAWTCQLLDAFVALKKPVLGVCYGMQLINLHFGGSLLAKLPEEDESLLDHGGGLQTTRHGLKFKEEASRWLQQLSETVQVASCHRQAVDQLAPGFLLTAQAPDGVIEAFEAPDALLCGVEWHPESDGTGPVVYGSLVRHCRERKRG